MKHPLVLKLTALFAIFLAAGFVIILSFAGGFINSTTIDRESLLLYREATAISGSYAAEYYNDEMTLSDLYTEISTLSAYLDSDIRVISTDGTVIADSSVSLDDENEVISGFNPADFTQNYGIIGSFYGSFKESMLSVVSPITINYRVRGYITIHKPISTITSTVDKYVNTVYKIFAIVAVAAIFIYILMLFIFYRPLNKITKTASNYGKANFDTPTGLHRSDELGTIASTMDAMAYELNTLEEDQRKFISNISHDFRSPLTSIRGFATAISDGTIPPELHKKYLDVIVFETMRLTKLTENLLELNKFGEKGISPIYKEFELNNIIKQTLAVFEGKCIEKNITINLILTGTEMRVSADEEKIRQVLSNLIDNAIKFSPENSEIKIETTERSGKVYVSVKDNGIGIPKESLSKIWDRFYKTDVSRGKDKTGSGLGLSIVREIIQAHGENINVISTVGVGTEFVFTIKAN